MNMTQSKSKAKSADLISSGFNSSDTLSSIANLSANAANTGFNFSSLNISSVPSGIQPKLTVGAPNDKYEQEADRVADKVMGMSAPQAVENNVTTVGVPKAQRSHSSSGAVSVNTGVENQLTSLAGGQPLPKNELNFFESRFGQDFSHVRIHTSAHADNAAKSINARAFTLGSDVTFASGEYQPGTTVGRRLMAHELTHVVQQNYQNNVNNNYVQRSQHKEPTYEVGTKIFFGAGKERESEYFVGADGKRKSESGTSIADMLCGWGWSWFC